MATTFRTRGAAHRPQGDASLRPVEVRLVVPWWANPLWALLLLSGSMGLVSLALPGDAYEEWLVPKFLDGDLAITLVLLMLAMAVGLFFGTGISPRARTINLRLDAEKVRLLSRTHRVLVVLTAIGYAAWALSAVIQGVGLNELLAVLQRSQGAIGNLKASARPIGGVTTLTQFAPIAVALNVLLWRMGLPRRLSLAFIFAAALGRVFFYAERLALIEVAVPAALIAAMILSDNPAWRRRLAIAPAVGVPVVWAVFAMSEYFRSWIYYQKLTDLSFVEWVTLRLIGYYTTSFNNSALLAQSYESRTFAPWFSMQWLWNFPGVDSIAQHPGIAGMAPADWWDYTLANNANVNFTNTGSFLATYAEWGLTASIVIWLLTGLAFGLLFNAACRGNVPSLLIYAALFVGILELPRLIYWTLGRSTPTVIAFLVLAFLWARASKSPSNAGSRGADTAT